MTDRNRDKRDIAGTCPHVSRPNSGRLTRDTEWGTPFRASPPCPGATEGSLSENLKITAGREDEAFPLLPQFRATIAHRLAIMGDAAERWDLPECCRRLVAAGEMTASTARAITGEAAP
jgi:hypothetical protein